MNEKAESRNNSLRKLMSTFLIFSQIFLVQPSSAKKVVDNKNENTQDIDRDFSLLTERERPNVARIESLRAKIVTMGKEYIKMSSAFSHFIQSEKGKELIGKPESEIFDYFYNNLTFKGTNLTKEKHKKILEAFDQEFRNFYVLIRNYGGAKRFIPNLQREIRKHILKSFEDSKELDEAEKRVQSLYDFFPKVVYMFGDDGKSIPNLLEGEFENYPINYELFKQCLFYFLLKERKKLGCDFPTPKNLNYL